jgi:peptide deformylase
MAIKEIVTFPDPVLNRVCTPVESFDDATKQLIEDLIETMYASVNGVGLAAPQIGSDKRAVVCDASHRSTGERELVVLINPEIIETDIEIFSVEGCLSCPELEVEVPRFEHIKVKALDQEGNPIIVESNDFLAIVMQHEIDHLNGKTIAHSMSSLKRKLYRRKLEKINEEREESE